jgi:hypothetical protein
MLEVQAVLEMYSMEYKRSQEDKRDLLWEIARWHMDMEKSEVQNKYEYHELPWDGNIASEIRKYQEEFLMDDIDEWQDDTLSLKSKPPQ